MIYTTFTGAGISSYVDEGPILLSTLYTIFYKNKRSICLHRYYLDRPTAIDSLEIYFADPMGIECGSLFTIVVL
jgi:hypothetical protein